MFAGGAAARLSGRSSARKILFAPWHLDRRAALR
jgi:hypothetical protein